MMWLVGFLSAIIILLLLILLFVVAYMHNIAEAITKSLVRSVMKQRRYDASESSDRSV